MRASSASPALSQKDRADGIATQALVKVKLLDRDRAHIRIGMQSTGSPIVAECQEPCEFVTMTPWDGYSYGHEQVMRLVPGTIIAMAFDDARNGFIDPPPRATPRKRPPASGAAST